MKRLCWSILLMVPLGASAADVYRSVDENGNVVYSDRPTDKTELIRINTTVPGVRPTAAAPARNDNNAASDASIVAEIPREATPEEIAADRAKNCELSRQQVTTFTESRRLFRQNADGEREYLSGPEIDAAIAKAESNVATWCD